MIMNMLDLSTAHIRPDTANWIDFQLKEASPHNLSPVIVFPKGDYGWFIHVPSYNDELFIDEIPADLLYLLGVAHGKQCQWLCLDVDAEVDPSIIKYDWQTNEPI